jgi:hypothetical protein
MMDLLENVAGVQNLRQKLMTMEYVSEFSMLLDSNLHGKEVTLIDKFRFQLF